MKLLKKLSYTSLLMLVALQSSNLKAQEPQPSWLWSLGKPLVGAIGVIFAGFAIKNAHFNARMENKHTQLEEVNKLQQRFFNDGAGRERPQLLFDITSDLERIEKRNGARTTGYFIPRTNQLKFHIAEKYSPNDDQSALLNEPVNFLHEATSQQETNARLAKEHRKNKNICIGVGVLGTLATAGVIGSYFWPKK